jgi:hypothetical protein
MLKTPLVCFIISLYKGTLHIDALIFNVYKMKSHALILRNLHLFEIRVELQARTFPKIHLIFMGFVVFTFTVQK